VEWGYTAGIFRRIQCPKLFHDRVDEGLEYLDVFLLFQRLLSVVRSSTCNASIRAPGNSTAPTTGYLSNSLATTKFYSFIAAKRGVLPKRSLMDHLPGLTRPRAAARVLINPGTRLVSSLQYEYAA